MNENDLTHFLYLILRDVGPAGAVEQAVRQAEEAKDRGFTYSNQELSKYANELAKRLCTEKRRMFSPPPG